MQSSCAAPVGCQSVCCKTWCADYFCRIAVHFNSPRTASNQGKTALYETLRNAKIYETDGVTSSLLLSQDGIPHEVEGKTTVLHLDEDGTSLKIYVPANKDDQDYTFAKALPERLFEWLMTCPISNNTEKASEKGATAVKDIILTPCSRIVMALEECGIRTVDIPNADEDVGQDSTSPECGTNLARAGGDGYQASVAGHDQEDVDSVPGDFDTPESSVVTPQHFSEEKLGLRLQANPQASGGPFVSPSQQSVLPIRSVQTQPTQDFTYLALLNTVIAAGENDKIPNRKESSRVLLREDFSATRNILDVEVRAASKFERYCKIGAAGELYVSP